MIDVDLHQASYFLLAVLSGLLGIQNLIVRWLVDVDFYRSIFFQICKCNSDYPM
jgi:hypothetical protein